MSDKIPEALAVLDTIIDARRAVNGIIDDGLTKARAAFAELRMSSEAMLSVFSGYRFTKTYERVEKALAAVDSLK